MKTSKVLIYIFMIITFITLTVFLSATKVEAAGNTGGGYLRNTDSGGYSGNTGNGGYSGNTGPTKNSSGSSGNSGSTDTVGGIDIDPDDFSNMAPSSDSTFEKIGGRIIGLVTYICYAAAVIILLYKGVQFMFKAPEAKAEAKKELVNYVIGAVIVFGIVTIIKIIGNIAMNSLFK